MGYNDALPAAQSGGTGAAYGRGSRNDLRVPNDAALPFQRTHKCRPPRGSGPRSTGTSRPGEERRQRAGFLTYRFNACPPPSRKKTIRPMACGGTLTSHSCGSSAGFADVATCAPDFPIKPLRAPVTFLSIGVIRRSCKRPSSHKRLAICFAGHYPPRQRQVPRKGIKRERGSRPRLPLQL